MTPFFTHSGGDIIDHDGDLVTLADALQMHERCVVKYERARLAGEIEATSLFKSGMESLAVAIDGACRWKRASA